MADLITAGLNSGEEAAQRAAEESEKQEIMEKIRQLELEKVRCEGVKLALYGMKERLKGVIFQINRMKDKKLEADIQRFSDVDLVADTQIALLDSYIVELRGKINALKASI
ncbi:MAG: hypothetical protein K2J95_06485 [Lachnospiraceae bacterium]|nr:hypothetical protein [Lachnospiraceae bacterium]MDE6743506.1 hypothetical protein [Lachnospiraceae bacterium]